ncbi:MAG: SH3 domain-containing protein [Campylobacterota bacterium]|nr:SH3 domain-containing protein [Campylobacterota bacterium]
MKLKFNTILVSLLLLTNLVFADADGPDYFKITGVANDDVLNIRTDANARATKIGEIPAGARCVKNLGCTGGLTMIEYTELSAEEKKAILRKRPRWCHIEYDGKRGWVSARYLNESSCAKAYQ